ncbi:MAG: selenocysteine-specific translation elongation factor [Pseudodesulfovibrio sp.]|uniref:Selenocysteine-specific elongation factor n=1 Tax=Pseudodesulfovibrio aespoeensis (strain ATCC 700646 / DSM 10631 / Aspo-2) TaxID=643562 RepID=E6VTJ3_PSEA9|nr:MULTISPECIES: selenocysteine-specific translation elongation factor [Pseudodesulfovibrio]MBU4192791.1 selenocysteine-specific translation elongation factor [Pseudomonadota bacterium]ADU62170.1 selenocysteine-specific translation elongation factor [Pseudodesulfovibrio aespoeensis Aspo-2]MBU4244781.1 selenocysteine-specific translation elongation factor [Pseudomonadota bacterium]MBU4380523.1 selenocysteine-specific translation elongation factor [Pseudomonadota bacterium]MBU4476141.1 selenocys
MPVIMGTAGHIDHGKTTLIKALTGIDCDRLSEEKKRGITIELGFAFLDLGAGSAGDDGRLGIVDVPGHEKFVKNMVAGATGVDFVMLVIAADEGIMPQTREHLEICQLLGVTTGLVALTKADMVDADWLEMVRDEVTSWLEPTFLGGAPVVPVSSHTGQGLDDLKDALRTLIADFTPRRRSDLFRLPVDRVFTMKGHGTVVTGTMISGSISVGEEIRLYPGDTRSKVRGLQSHGVTVETAQAGRRTAVNLHGLEVDGIRRGDVLARPGTLFPSAVWDIELTVLESSRRPLKHRKEVHFHHGSREVLARVYLIDRDELKPGETAVCQVRFTEPLAGVYGDRIVLRSFSPLRAFAGGRVVGPSGHKVKRFSPKAEALRALADDAPEAVAAAQLELAGPQGVGWSELLTMTNLESKALEKTLGVLGGQQKAILFDREARRYAGGQLVQELSDGLLDWLAAFHRKDSMKPGVQRGELASSWGRDVPQKLFHFIVERLLKKGDMVAEQELLRLKDHSVSLASDQEAVRTALLAAYGGGGVTPPNLKDVLEPLGLTARQVAPVLKLLQDQGELVRVKDDMYYHGPALNGIREAIVGFFETRQEMSAPDFKDLTGLSRKYLIPVLEHFDKEKLTVRVGDVRHIRKRS